MNFISLSYILFFSLVCAVYFSLPVRTRWAWLLGASSWFYMAFIPQYILVLFALILIDYGAGLAMERMVGKARPLFLLASCCANLGILFFFKYSGTHWALPLGLSFHTFQSLGYVIDVYRRERPAERHLGIYALYVMFFPQLVAGPIERSKNLLVQLHEPQQFDDRRAARGLQLILWGVFQKICLADRLAPYVDRVYANPHGAPGWALLIATLFFAFQIYFDFCGYSNIAIGSAEILGFRLMRNFAAPYLALSVVDFWRRWHISLSSWFRDYLYIPLGGNRLGRWRRNLNILVVFILSGFWHGANWTFGVWGLLHGLYVVGYYAWKESVPLEPKPDPWRRALARVGTFGFVTFAWIFFRAATVQEAFLIAGKVLTLPFTSEGATFLNALQYMDLPVYLFGLYAGILAIFLAVDYWGTQRSLRDWLARQSAPIRWSVYYAAVCGTIVFAVLETKQFIYFQF